MKPFGVSFRIGVATIGIVGALFVWGPPAIAAASEESGLEELWRQYPLETEHGPTVRVAPVADAPALPERAPGMQSGRGMDAGEGSGEGWQLALGLAVLAILLAAGGFALLQAFGSAPILRLPTAEGWGPWNMRLWPLAVPMPAAVSPSRSVLESLIRAATASPRNGPARAVRTAAMSDRPTAAPSNGRRVAPPSGASPQSSADQADLLKEKAAMHATTLLKVKQRAGAAHVKEQLTRAERNLLKEKLAARPRHMTRAKTEAPRVAQNRPDLKRSAVLQPVPRPAESRTPRARSNRRVTAPRSTRTCEVHWWRGYVMSEFFVVETTSEGTERTVARSPAFRWRKRDVPTKTPEAVAALSALVTRLQDEGWTLTGRGENWFNAKLQSSRARDYPERIPD